MSNISIQRQGEAFNELQKGEFVTIDDMFEIKKNYSFSRDYEIETGKYAHIHYGDIHSLYDGIIDNNTKFKFINTPEKEYSLVSNDEVVIADASEDYYDLGKCLYIKQIPSNVKLLSGLHTFNLKSKGSISMKVFYQFTKSDNYKLQMSKLGTGLSVFGITKENLKKIKFKKIKNENEVANFLTSLDSLIQKQEEYIEELKIQKKGYSQKIFNQELRFEGFEDVWKLTDLQSISNKIYSGGTPKSSNNEYYNGDIPFLSISDIDNMQINSTQKYISEEGLKNSPSKIVGKNNIIYTMYATPGLAVINKIDVAIPQSVMGIELTVDNDKSYVCNYLNYKRDDILAYGMTGTQTNLTGQIVKEMVVEIPKESEQKKIGEFLSALDGKIELQEHKLEQLKLKKKYYLNKIFV